MAPSLLVLLLCCVWPVDCRTLILEPTRKPDTTKTMRLAKADDGAKHSVVDFSEDIDGEPDSSGEFTSASLSKPDMPRDFTICAAFMVQAWTTDFTSAHLFQLRSVDNELWAYFNLYSRASSTTFTVKLGELQFVTAMNPVLFPLTWTRACLSLDTISGKVGVVVNGQLIQEQVHQEALKDDGKRPSNMSLVLGLNQVTGTEYTGKTSNLNIFTSALSTARMIALTQAGGEECGAPGDYVSCVSCD